MLEPASLTVAYESGPWIAIAGSESWLLADVAPDSAVVAGWWSALQAGAGLDDLLAVILDEGLRAVPSFAALGLTDGGLRLLVRGLAQVEIRRGDDAPDSVAGSNATTWTDIRTEGWTQVRLGAPARSAGAPRLPLPLLLGVTLAGALVLEREAAPIQRTPTVETVRGASLRASIPPPPGPPPGTPPTPPPASAPPVSAPPASQQPSIVLPPPAAPPPSPPAPARNFDHLFGATGAAPAAAEPSAEVT
ncbi:MAG: hypothetical protein JWQ77_3923, partial [Jatrophihabitans sp.]|nr:hypothetical protein [Jatrophihabitans sp.]